MRRIFTALAAVTLVGAATAADATAGGQPLTNDHAYMFTQQQRDNLPWNGTWVPQTVPHGAHIQVQLPSDPVRWIPDTSTRCRPSPLAGLVPTSLLPLRGTVELYHRGTLPNEGRLTGSSQLSILDYRVTGLGIAAICLRPDPVPDNPEVLGFPAGTPPYFVATVLVGIPQLTVP